MTQLEEKTASLLVEAGEAVSWEYAASLAYPKGPLLEFITEMQDNKANPSATLLYLISKWPNIVLHHNHLSGESLSFGDWRGASLYFNEIFAHCNDGTAYYGKVLDKNEVPSLSTKNLEVLAQNHLFDRTEDPDISYFFRKEVINRAFEIRGLVEYGCSWGTLAIPHPTIIGWSLNNITSIGQLGMAYDNFINLAASDLSNDNW
ncbi:hypothetical protein NGI13_05640 [Enterobacter asburiae]|uniref:hypothetical protein n=1 Tax=Enterobacter asburiae TaxID=61645 RepID=UPI002DBDE218|nr:hypothetical protein [Enterobacter asburiae]MEB8255051.1 hypothetical protein [Enterobacter asburiae]